MPSATAAQPETQHRAVSIFAMRPGMMPIAIGLLGDVAIAALKFGAAGVTASSSMFAEGMHSVMDVMTEIILLYGIAISRRPATKSYQLGFGREAFFWNFVAALLILAAGSGVTLHDGMRQLLHPQPIEHAVVNFIVLGIAVVVEMTTTFYAIHKGRSLLSDHGLLGLFRSSRDPSRLTIVFTGFAGLAGLVIAAIGASASLLLGKPALDGAASICIAMIMAFTALALAVKCKSLLIGVAASPSTVKSITAAAAAHPAVLQVNGAITVHLSAEQLLVGLSIAFKSDLTTGRIEDAVADINSTLRESHPEIVNFFAKPQDRARFDALKAKRGW